MRSPTTGGSFKICASSPQVQPVYISSARASVRPRLGAIKAVRPSRLSRLSAARRSRRRAPRSRRRARRSASRSAPPTATTRSSRPTEPARRPGRRAPSARSCHDGSRRRSRRRWSSSRLGGPGSRRGCASPSRAPRCAPTAARRAPSRRPRVVATRAGAGRRARLHEPAPRPEAAVRVQQRFALKAKQIQIFGGFEYLSRGDFYNSPGPARRRHLLRPRAARPRGCSWRTTGARSTRRPSR